MRATAALLLLLALTAIPAAGAAPARPYLDLDFEAPECSGGWFLQGIGYEAVIDRAVKSSGRQSLRVSYVLPQPWNPDRGEYAVTQSFPAPAVAGRRVRYSGDIKTQSSTGLAGLWWVARDAAGRAVAGDSMSGREVTGTTPWTRYSVEIDVPASVATVSFGVFHAGEGTSWFDGLAVEIDGRRWVEGRRPVAAPSPAAVSWLKKRAIPFATAEPASGLSDLQALKRVIGDARIVSLGEGTHGTREFFQMKHRLIELMAEEMGFTLFAIEASMPEAQLVNDYVLTGRGDPAALIRGMGFWTWDTEEVLEMVLWMRELNASGRGRIQFLGFDMQNPDLASDNAASFLAKAEPAYSREAGDAFNKVKAVDALGRNAFGSGQAREAEQAARQVLDHMEQRRGDYLGRYPSEEVDWAIQNARIVLQVAQSYTGSASRDTSMAKNVEWILDQAPEGSKIVLWAHNAHVNRVPGWMGTFLSERYGDDMLVVGFAFAEGRYTAISENGSLRDNEALPPPPGTVEAYLRSARIPRFLVDLRNIPAKAPSAPWLKKERPFRLIGSVATRCAFNPAVVAKEYDALIWIERTNPSVLLPQ